MKADGDILSICCNSAKCSHLVFHKVFNAVKLNQFREHALHSAIWLWQIRLSVRHTLTNAHIVKLSTV